MDVKILVRLLNTQIKIKWILRTVFILYSVFFFMGTNVFVDLTHLKLPQISKTNLKIFVWSGHLIKYT